MNLNKEEDVRGGEEMRVEDLKHRSQWGLKRRPVIPVLSSQTDELFSSRQTNVRMKYVAQQKESNDVRAQANLGDQKNQILRSEKTQKSIEVNNLKENSRRAYTERHAKRLAARALTNTLVPINLNMRVYLYGRHHRCPHGLAFNRVVRAIDGNSYSFSCDHSVCDKVHRVEPKKCNSCGNQMHVEYINTLCKCGYFSCDRCRRPQYTYTYVDRVIVQCFDKHGIQPQQTTVVVDREEIIETDYSFLTKGDVTRLRKQSRKNFFLELKGERKLTYAELLAGASAKMCEEYNPMKDYSKVASTWKDHPCWKVKKTVPEGGCLGKQPEDVMEMTTLSKRKMIYTQPEGGTMSAMIDPIVSASTGIKERLIGFKSKIKDKLYELRKYVRDKIISITLRTVMDGLLDTLFYIVNVIFDYAIVLNPIMIYRLWTALDNKPLFLIYLAEAMVILNAMEVESQKNLVDLTNKHPMETLRKLCKQDKLPHIGVLNSAFRSALKSHKKDGEVYLILRKLGFTTQTVRELGPTTYVFKYDKKLANAADKITTPESGQEGLMQFVMDFFSKIPNCFKTGIDILTKFFKDYMPLLMGIRSLVDITKNLDKLVDGIMKFIYGYSKDPRDWIEYHISKPDNPIHDLVVAYTTYTVAVVANKTENMGDVRTQFYAGLVKADAFVLEAKKFGTVWFSFKAGLERGFTQPPRPVEREFEPTVLTLSGKPGVGKSTLWNCIVAKEVIDVEQPDYVKQIADMTHTWNISSDFQVGMSNKRIILFDDFAQNREDQTDIVNVIALATTAPYPINSPNITGQEIKGMFCTPDIIVICTNVTPEVAAQGMADSVALLRRYDIDFEVLKRYNPDKPDEHIFKVRSCVHYESLQGRTMNMNMARALFSTINRKKRKLFTETKTMVAELIATDVRTVIGTPLGDFEGDTKNNAWLHDGDFFKDFQKFVLTKEESMSGFFSSMADNANLMRNLTISLALQGVIIGVPVVITMCVARVLGDLEMLLRDERSGNPFLGKENVTTMLKSMLRCAVISVSALAASFAIFKIMVPQPESGGTRTAKRQLTNVRTLNEAGMQDLTVMFENATGSVRVDESGMIVNCVFVGGHFVLLPYHIFTDRTGLPILEDQDITFTKSTWNGITRTTKFKKTSLIRLTGNVYKEYVGHNLREDVCLYKLPTSEFSAERNISKHFWKGDYPTLNFPVTKLDFVPYNLDGTYKGKFIQSNGTITHDAVQTLRMEGIVQTYHVLGEANYSARASSCGSIVMRSDIQQESILGFHTASANGVGYFHYVTQQSIIQGMGKTIVVDVESPYTITHAQGAIVDVMPEKSVLFFEGMVDNVIFQPTKTDIIPSLIHGVMGPVETGPAPMSYRDARIATEYKTYSGFYRKLFAGYGYIEGDFLASELQVAHQSVIEDVTIIQKKSIVKTKKLTLMEAINGLAYIPGNTRIDMQSSCGYPYAQEGLKKTDLFFEEDGVIYPQARIIKDYERAMQLISSGVVPFLPFGLTLKDERIKLAKIVDPRTRIFACGNVIHFLIMRTYFYTMLMQFYHANGHDSFCFPSLDRHSYDWHRLSMQLTEVGMEGFDFDFSHYDRSLKHAILYFSTKILLKGMILPHTEEAALVEILCSPIMIWGSSVLRSCGVLMSGGLLTYLINCVANELIHRAAWKGVMMQECPNLVEFRFYKAYTRAARGGDDTVTLIDERIKEFYNGQTVAKFLNERGMKVTSANKAIEISKTTAFFELSFLKNTTRMERGVFLPVTELKSLEESTYWVRLNKHNNDIVKATQDNTICSMRGMFFHGEKVLNDFRSAALEREPRLILPTYADLSAIWRSYLEFPGSHADFASRELQVDPFTAMRPVLITDIAKVDRIISDKMIVVETIAEARALDKVVLETVDMINGSPTDPISAVDSTVIANEGDSVEKGEKTTIGTTIQDTSSRKVLALTTGNNVIQSKNLRAEQYCNDISWDLNKLVEKFTHVRDVQWSITDVVNKSLVQMEVPKDFLVTPAQMTPFEVTRLWKMKQMVVKLVIKASPFYAGGLVVGFTPFNGSPDIQRIINRGALIQKISQSEALELIIPFRFPVGYLSIDLKETLGRFSIFVNSPLATGADNPNNISISIYVSFEESNFKLPDVIPVASYVSRKFKKTVQESGIATVLCDINESVQEMEKTVMCAGEGLVGQPQMSHFQDAPNDLVQLLKRWRNVSSGLVTIAGVDKVTLITFDYASLLRAACAGFDKTFGMFRGSINMRVMLQSESEVHGTIHMTIGNIVLGGTAKTWNAGHQHFGKDIAQVTIPWLFPYFAYYTPDMGLLPGLVFVRLTTPSIKPVVTEMIVEMCVGDDFHFGVYMGGSEGTVSMFRDVRLVPAVTSSIANTRDFVFVPTKAEAGVMQFINRAIENTLPLVEEVSKLAVLLDAHMITEQPAPIWPRRIPYSIATDQVQYTERLLTTNHNGMSLPDEECFGVDTTETSISNLMTNTKSLSSRFSWQAIDPVGTPLISLFNGPGLPNNGPGDIHSKIPSMFNYWTGSTIYIFDIHATEMHRGQLLFSYNPAPITTAYRDATQTYFTTFDLSQGRGTIALVLPYLSVRPYSKVVKMGEARGVDNATGCLTVFVQNPLRATSTVAGNVQVVVYKSFGTDFQLGVYGGTQTGLVKGVIDPSAPPMLRREHSKGNLLPDIREHNNINNY